MVPLQSLGHDSDISYPAETSAVVYDRFDNWTVGLKIAVEYMFGHST